MSVPATQSQPPALAVRDLRVSLRGPSGPRKVVDGVTLELAAGSITGLVGASGSGKTVTALALLGLTDPGAFDVSMASLNLGQERIDTTAHGALAALRGRRIAMVFQDPATALDPVMTIGSQLERTLRRLQSVRGAEARRRAGEALQSAGFDHPESILRRYPHELSGGMRQRCAIALAQAARPSVLLADEPTTALDTVTQRAVLGEIQRLAVERGIAVLLVSHDLRLMARYADAVYVMQEGHIVDRTRGPDLHRAPAHPYTAGLVAALPRLEHAEGRGRRRATEPATAAAPDSAFTGISNNTATPLLRVRDLHVAYRQPGPWPGSHGDPVHAVRGLSIDLEQGRIHGLAGASGSGKSTLARALVQLVMPASGSIELEGRELLGADRGLITEARRRIQLVFQDPGAALSPRRTVSQTLREAARHFRLDASRERLVSLLEAVHLEPDLLPRLPGQLSSGQRQRVAIARALVCEPDLLVADEALASLDVQVQAHLLDLLRELSDARGLAILLISHDLAILGDNADRISVMADGTCVESASPEDLFASPRHPWTRRLLDAMPRLDPGFAPPDPDGALREPGRDSGHGTDGIS